MPEAAAILARRRGEPPSPAAARARQRRIRLLAGIVRDFRVRVPTRRLVAAMRAANPRLPEGELLFGCRRRFCAPCFWNAAMATVEFNTNVRQARPANGHAKFATPNQIGAEGGARTVR